MAGSERPQIINILIVYLLIQLILVILLYRTLGLGWILMIFAMYNGLYKMKKGWMWVVVFLLLTSAIAYAAFAYYGRLDIVGYALLPLNIIFSVYLIIKRDEFVEGEKKAGLSLKRLLEIIVILVIVVFALMFMLFATGALRAPTT